MTVGVRSCSSPWSYVDGEDLSALLKRIGRFPEDKAAEIARQVCAGLAAAHDKGILHRDLKPANIMLDGDGRVRLMDFSLASVGTVSDVRAGTPAYMAPEQLQGREVTTRSDIFALGLVLYELFTGRRVFTAKTIAELVSQHESGVTTSMTDVVKTIDPTVERVIQRCLDPDPSRRPVSALAVAAQLSADPLAAALAAGETPSPEMIAAAGGEAAALSACGALSWAAGAVAALLLVAAISDRTSIAGRVPVTLSADVLADRARQAREGFGHTAAFADDAFGFRSDGDYLARAARNPSSNLLTSLPTGRPAAMRFWYRTSPQLLIPLDDTSRVVMSDPPSVLGGMVALELDTAGRVLFFLAVPRQIEPPADVTTPTANWRKAFELAGLPPDSFTETTPQWTPRTHSDERKAWSGEWPELPGVPIRIEAAAYRGQVTTFDVVAPWSRATREVPLASTAIPWVALFGGVIVSLLPVGAVWMAWRNWQAGRGDGRGAVKTGGVVTLMTLLTWVLSPPHIADINVEVNRFFIAVGYALFNGALVLSVYLAVEPHVRRLWPTALITWSRITTGRWRRDPMLGRDIVIGAGLGIGLAAMSLVYELLPAVLGWPERLPGTLELGSLLGVREWLVSVVNRLLWALQNGLVGIMMLTLVRMVLGRWPLTSRLARPWPLALFVTALFTIVSNRTGSLSTYFWLDWMVGALISFVLVSSVVGWGLLANVLTFFFYLCTTALLLTLDSSRLYFAGSAWLMALLVGIVLIGYRWSRADEPLFG
ncbi:MAG: serine/threonine protein kinase [Acidimicrobiia bacterium]|nr:serine/threonine protein kinase [Acidimicrobiia bacterium]